MCYHPAPPSSHTVCDSGITRHSACFNPGCAQYDADALNACVAMRSYLPFGECLLGAPGEGGG